MKTLLLILALAIGISAQTTRPSIISDSEDLQTCSQMLDKTLDTLRACKDTVEAKNAELSAEKQRSQLQQDQIVEYRVLVERLNDRIKYLESIKCSKLSLFFGIIKWKSCSL